MTPRKFIIFANARSGSTLLVKSLDSHSKLNVMPEVLHDHYDEMINWRRERNLHTYEPLDSLSNYDEIISKIHSHIDGFKIIHLNKVNISAIIDTVNRMNIPVIILKRENIVKSVLSLCIARETKKWQNYDFQTVSKISKTMVVDPLEVVSEIERIENFFNALKCIKTDTLHISYESMVEQWDNHINKILDFIGCDRETIEMKVGKLIQDNHVDYIDNYDQIQQYIHQTKWRIYLQDIPHEIHYKLL